MTQQATITDELAFSQHYGEQEKQILTPEAVEFLTELVSRFTPARNKLLAARLQQQQAIDDGQLPDFISETASIRNSDWTIRGIPADLQDRRVEITGPVERKMVINALNANVKVFMADFEDSLAPDWRKVIDGQINLRDAVNGTISYTNEAGKIYQLQPNPAVLVCRVRGLHLPEKHVTWRNEAIPGSLFDGHCFCIEIQADFHPCGNSSVDITNKRRVQVSRPRIAQAPGTYNAECRPGCGCACPRRRGRLSRKWTGAGR